MSKNKSSGILGLSYPDKCLDEASRCLVKFEDIIKFSNHFKQLKKNYIWFQTKNGHTYYVKSSLSRIYEQLPDYFARINKNEIINIKKANI